MDTALVPVRPTTRALVALLVCGAVAAGCNLGLPQAQSDPTKNFVLSAPALAAPTLAPKSDAPVVRLRSVELPGYLRTRSIVVRSGENEVDFREFARWGEPLEQGIARVLREELLSRGAASEVLMTGSRTGDAADTRYELTVRVLACEGVADGSVAFRATWEVVNATGRNTVVARGDFHPTDLRWAHRNEATLAAAVSKAVAGLAADIAAALPKS